METKVIETRSLGSRPTVVATATVSVAEIGPWLHRVSEDIARYLRDIGERPAGPPFARYHRRDDGRLEVEAGFPVTRQLPGTAQLTGSALPAGTMAIITHIGPYDDLGSSYETLESWIEARGAVPEGDPWEVYFSGPAEPPETWRTDIVQPYRAA